MARHLQMELLLSTFIAIFCIKHTLAVHNNTGFSLQLIDTFSFRLENLTDREKFEQLKKSSQARVNWLEMSRSLIYNQSHETTLRPVVDHFDVRYVAQLHVGKDNIQQNLYIDTGSFLTWIQCHPCDQCYAQEEPFYQPDASSSYRPLQCDHPYCKAQSCKDNACQFDLSYADSTYVKGNLATELFEGIDGVIFGCVREASENYFHSDDKLAIGGLIGMNAAPGAFPLQLAGYTQGRFSHCFVPDFERTTSYLRFGDNIIDNPNYPKTAIIRSPTDWYYVQLNDISVNDERLNLPQGIFNLNGDGTGGVLFDSGTALTTMIPEAYQTVETAFRDYFSGYGLIPVSIGGPEFNLCYETRGRFNFMPNMTLHFEGGDLLLESNNLFYHTHENEFCLVINTRPQTILGVKMQQEVRFVYDLNNWQISFGRENCAFN